MSIRLSNALQLPVDLLLLTFDFLRLTRWRLARVFAKALGVLGPHSGPFCGRRWRTQDAEGAVSALCGHAGRYRNKFVFGWLCPWAIGARGGLCFCRRRRSYRLPVVRYLMVGGAVVTMWVGIGYGLFRLSI